MKKTILVLCAAVLLLSMLTSCSYWKEAIREKNNIVKDVYYVVHGFEWGPGVDKVILSLKKDATGIDSSYDTAVKTAQWEREVTAIYLSDADGEPVSGPSSYVALEFVTDIECPGSPLAYDPETQTNHWADSFIVDVSLGLIVGGKTVQVDCSTDCADNRLCPEMEYFPVTGTYSESQMNVLSGSSEMLTLNYAATQPDYLEGGEKNPLIIWLHGRGEGGTDIANAILGNEVSALAQETIQSYFISGEQTGAYVLAVQTPTYWMDAGDDVENEGDMNSRYETILMDTILAYLDSNPDVDRDRIYLLGGSNGGFMTMEMLIQYPDFFAAAIPCSPAFAYYVYARNEDGSYKTFGNTKIKTNSSFLTEDKIDALMQTPIWIICAATDTLVATSEYAAPIYYELLTAGADNCWCSMYIGVEGTEGTEEQYMGHWTWVYLFNDDVSYVQDPQAVIDWDGNSFLYGMTPNREGGTVQVPDGKGVYKSAFAWLNDQSLSEE